MLYMQAYCNLAWNESISYIILCHICRQASHLSLTDSLISVEIIYALYKRHQLAGMLAIVHADSIIKISEGRNQQNTQAYIQLLGVCMHVSLRAQRNFNVYKIRSRLYELQLSFCLHSCMVISRHPAVRGRIYDRDSRHPQHFRIHEIFFKPLNRG